MSMGGTSSWCRPPVSTPGKCLKKILIPSAFGVLAVLDATFSPAGSSSSIVAGDSGGRLILLGTEDGTLYSSSYPEQFFENDYNELLRDQNSGN